MCKRQSPKHFLLGVTSRNNMTCKQLLTSLGATIGLPTHRFNAGGVQISGLTHTICIEQARRYCFLYSFMHDARL